MSTTLASLEPFLAALREHATLAGAEGGVSEEEFATKTDQLRLAARLYSEEIYETTGWDNPFYDLFDEFDTEEATAEYEGDDYDFEGDPGYGEVRLDGSEANGSVGDPASVGQSAAWPRDRVQLTENTESAESDTSDEDEEVVRVSVATRHDFYVGDEATLVEYVRERLRQANPELAEADLFESTQDAENAICELMEIDAWDLEPYAAATMEPAGAEVEVSYVDLTLEELEEMGLDDDDDEADEEDELDDDELEDGDALEDDDDEYEYESDDEESFDEDDDNDLDDDESEDDEFDDDDDLDDEFEGDDDFEDESDIEADDDPKKSPTR